MDSAVREHNGWTYVVDGTGPGGRPLWAITAPTGFIFRMEHVDAGEVQTFIDVMHGELSL